LELITNKDERIQTFYSSLEQLKSEVDTLLQNYSPPFNGERFMTDKDLSGILKVSRRTLLDYRNQGVLSYIQLGGKILYRESDIEKLLCDSYRKAWKL